jgi:2-phosphosulfolactate phosphatase
VGGRTGRRLGGLTPTPASVPPPIPIVACVTPSRLPGPDPAQPTGALVFDVLRATTTLAYAFRSGASEARFYRTPGSARRVAPRAPVPVLLCGERLGYRIEGFDLGNSPGEYTADRVAGATLLFASTNGSRAFLSSKFAERQWAAGFVNGLAAAGEAADWVMEAVGKGVSPRLLLVCAGKEGEPAIEDSLGASHVAGLVEAALKRQGLAIERVGDRLPPPPADAELAAREVRESPHGRYLRSLGPAFVNDVELCARWDSIATVPSGSAGRLFRSRSPAR